MTNKEKSSKKASQSDLKRGGISDIASHTTGQSTTKSTPPLQKLVIAFFRKAKMATFGEMLVIFFVENR